MQLVGRAHKVGWLFPSSCRSLQYLRFRLSRKAVRISPERIPLEGRQSPKWVRKPAVSLPFRLLTETIVPLFYRESLPLPCLALAVTHI
jgi:hypothetical protein